MPATYRKRVRLPEPEHWPIVMLDNGQVLNAWESKVWWALTLLKLRFKAQQGFGPARALGGALVDFFLIDYKADLDPAGPWHYTTEGQTRDWWRNVTRAQFGIRHILMPPYVVAYDMDRLKGWIMKEIGSPVSYAWGGG